MSPYLTRTRRVLPFEEGVISHDPVHIWVALAGLLCALFVLKLLLQVGMAGSGHRVNWSSYNAMLLGLLIVVFFPIMVLFACLKKMR